LLGTFAMPDDKIIVVGASAGGVEALQELVGALPADLVAPVLIVLHIGPDSPSILPTILGRRTRLEVKPAEDGERLRPGVVYVAVPDRHLLVEKDRTLRTPRGPRENRHRPAVDPLFRSAALAYGPNTIAVVLTGTRDDGTAGAISVNRCGGVVVAQDPEEAMHRSMPQSAIEHARVDHVVGLAEMPELLARLVAAPRPSARTTDTEQIEMEKEIAAMAPEAMDGDDRPGRPSPFSCPDCGGVLWEIDENDMTRYRCRVGHAYSPESMVGAVDDALEEALWTALKTLEESARLSHRLAENERKLGHRWLVERFDEREAEARQRAEVIRRFLGQSSPSISVDSQST
jgi:two-component system chemotaxis response regulator CheB